MLVLFVASSAAAGCGSSPSPFRDGCVAKVEYQGSSYAEAGFSSTDVEKLGDARIVKCADAHDDTVTAWNFPGFDAGQVIAVREDDDVVRVFFADGLSEAERQQLVDAHLLNAGDQ